MADVEDFLRRLLALSKETGFWISGCGDCGSPWIERQEGTSPAHEVTPTTDYDGYEYSISEESPERVIVK